MNTVTENKRIESRLDMQTYLDKLKYAIKNGSSKFNFQKNRKVDENRNKKYTNRYTLSRLFPEEDEIEAIKREFASLEIENYIETVKDFRFPKKSEMRVFGKVYVSEDVYIKIRVELINMEKAYGETYILVMSFHYSDKDFEKVKFPYCNS